MKELIALIIIALFGAVGWYFYFLSPKDEGNSENVVLDGEAAGELVDVPSVGSEKISDIILEDKVSQGEIVSPLDRAKDRVTKKPFGIYITRENSPIKPERFSGYHTGADFEIFANEINIDVPVKSVCTGKVVKKENISGYGGVLIAGCKLNNETVTVVYGHLKLESISKNVGDDLTAGEVIGNLGKNKSVETDGERKHLHLGIHKGLNINYSGYVFSKDNLGGWIDPCEYFCK